MSAQDQPRHHLLLDACCVLNLFASGHIEDILGALSWRFAVVTAVSEEALWVYRGGSDDDASERDSVDLAPLVMKGLLEIWAVETDEEADEFIKFAALLDDGEAMTAALAIQRGAAMATDDRKALRIVSARAPSLRLLTTAQLLHSWAQEAKLEPKALAAALQSTRVRARFFPSRQDPFRSWWDAATRST